MKVVVLGECKMKTLIIASGHCGTTLKAARILADKIGGADIFDTKDKFAKIDFLRYDTFIFGSNVRMYMLNFRFSKWARKLRKFYKTKNVYGYLIGATENGDKILQRFSNKLPKNKGVVYAWGELAIESSVGQTKKMYEEMKAECLQKGNKLPHIKEDELEKLAQLIKEA